MNIGGEVSIYISLLKYILCHYCGIHVVTCDWFMIENPKYVCTLQVKV